MGSRLDRLECARCGRTYSARELHNRCDCGGTLLARYDLSKIDLEEVRRRPRGMWRYEELLPVTGARVSLGEVETPLLFAHRLSERWQTEVWIKDDGVLPTGTFKARGAAVGLSKAVELGVKSVVMPSAGNAGGAWSLYAARAGIDITVTMARTAPTMNQAEVTNAGGQLELVDGTIADAGARAAEIAEETGAYLVTTFSEPYRLEGKKSCWLELFDRLGSPSGRRRLRTVGDMRLPRTIVLPVGGGVGAIAAAKAADEVAELGWTSDDPPVLIGVQPDRCAPIVAAFENGDDEVEPWAGEPRTAAAGLRVPAPVEGALVLQTIRASGGLMVAVEERRILDSVRDLAASEGVFACPEGAATVAAADELARAGRLDGPVVLYNTGAGAKYAAWLDSESAPQ
ncbi:MAG TPA: threonine synthase [Actinomycetota bacterium]|jgi:threonine synthase